MKYNCIDENGKTTEGFGLSTVFSEGVFESEKEFLDHISSAAEEIKKYAKEKGLRIPTLAELENSIKSRKIVDQKLKNKAINKIADNNFSITNYAKKIKFANLGKTNVPCFYYTGTVSSAIQVFFSIISVLILFIVGFIGAEQGAVQLANFVKLLKMTKGAGETVAHKAGAKAGLAYAAMQGVYKTGWASVISALGIKPIIKLINVKRGKIIYFAYAVFINDEKKKVVLKPIAKGSNK